MKTQRLQTIHARPSDLDPQIRGTLKMLVEKKGDGEEICFVLRKCVHEQPVIHRSGETGEAETDAPVGGVALVYSSNNGIGKRAMVAQFLKNPVAAKEAAEEHVIREGEGLVWELINALAHWGRGSVSVQMLSSTPVPTA